MAKGKFTVKGVSHGKHTKKKSKKSKSKHTKRMHK